MYASKQSEDVEEKRHLRMIDDRHANVQSVGPEDGLLVPRLRRFEDKHSGIIYCNTSIPVTNIVANTYPFISLTCKLV